jgi:hypothetical protein
VRQVRQGGVAAAAAAALAAATVAIAKAEGASRAKEKDGEEGNKTLEEKVKAEVATLCKEFPIY